MEGSKLSRNNYKKTVQFHGGRILFFVLLYSVVLFFYFFLYGYMQLMLLVVLTVLPICSLVSVWLLADSCRVRLTASEENTVRGEGFAIGILLHNGRVFSALHALYKIKTKNTFYGTKAEMTISAPVLPKGETKTELPLVSDYGGLVEITVEELEIRDFCGLISLKLALDLKKSICVLPKSVEPEETQKAGFYAGIADNEEEMSKGHDFADTSNIREYVPGDRMKDIHWKLSAKKEILLVKERVKMAENQLIIWLELTQNPHQTDEVLELCYNMIRFCIKEGVLVKLFYHSDNSVIESLFDLKEAILKIYATGTKQEEVVGKMGLQEKGRPIRTYVKVSCQDGKAGVTVVENDV